MDPETKRRIFHELAPNRQKWRWRGRSRPPFASATAPGQESVWDYPRPPAMEPINVAVRVLRDGRELAQTSEGGAIRVLETASPPTVYLHPSNVDLSQLRPGEPASLCEWKGVATPWFAIDAPRDAGEVGWSYDDPFEAFVSIAGWLSFYPARVECFFGGQRVQPQRGPYYGGWVTENIVGPWKGQRSDIDDSAW